MAARVIAVACAFSLVVSCVSFGIASAGGGVSDSRADDDAKTFASASSDGAMATASETLVLESAAQRDISCGIDEIAAEEEAARIAVEEAARAEEAARIAAAEQAKAEAAAREVPALSDVDFSCGKEAFLAEWTSRIDAYLAGSPLAGYGKVFAEAAWDNGVDPRWSPAISNTESSKGRNCFRPYNAWGWMAESWSSWEEAVNAHVAGLARGYGYTISLENARKYCPPTYHDWYAKTVSEMAKI